MSETTTAPAAQTATQEATTATEPTANAVTAPAAIETPTEPATAKEPATVEELPKWAQDQIKALRKEDGDERVAKKTLDAIQQALNPDAGEGEKPTPEALAAQVTEHQQAATKATERADAAEVKLAVILASLEQDADHTALLDSNSFLATLKGLTPDDGEKITAAITAAVEKNPKLKAARAATVSRVDTSAGSGEGAVTQEQFNAMNYTDKATLFQTNPTLYRQLAG